MHLTVDSSPASIRKTRRGVLCKLQEFYRGLTYDNVTSRCFEIMIVLNALVINLKQNPYMCFQADVIVSCRKCRLIVLSTDVLALPANRICDQYYLELIWVLLLGFKLFFPGNSRCTLRGSVVHLPECYLEVAGNWRTQQKHVHSESVYSTQTET